MAALFEITGILEVQRRLEQFAAEVLPLAGIALQQEADDILEKSQPLVPVDTRALKKSGKVDDIVIAGAVVSTAVRYGGPGEEGGRRPENYAITVHEDVTMNHPRGGQAKFLQAPAFEATAGMAERLADALRLAL